MDPRDAATSPTSASTEAETLGNWLRSARNRTLALVKELEGRRWLGPRLEIVNPLAWELGHVGWFQEYWCLRGGGQRPSFRRDADALYDSAKVPHKVRWDLPLPDPERTHLYLADVLGRVLDSLARGVSPEHAYYLRLAVFHEDMHGEALMYTRQTLGDPAPRLGIVPRSVEHDAPRTGDVEVPGGAYAVGAREGEYPFVFDNEKWAHEVVLAPFAIARCAVTEGEFAAFVDDGGYARPDLWSPDGWAWREREGATAPLYWRKEGGTWLRRAFDRWERLSERRAMIHPNAHEAEAYCAWAGRRLPREAEWEVAAQGAAAAGPARLDGLGLGPGEVDEFPDGDSAFGLRQMLGNVWEWTADSFQPYPGFVIDPYAEYSAPWFGNHRVLRGGCWATRARLLRPTWRNFYTPDRRDVFAGFRTCRVGPA